MIPDLSDIARGRRIVALAARDLMLVRRAERPARPGLWSRLRRLWQR